MGHLQVVDAAEAAVVEDQDVGLDPLLHDGSQFAVQHLEARVDDHRIFLHIRLGHLNAHGCTDFIAHAGVTVLHMVTAALVGFPHALQIARKGAAGRDDVVIFPDCGPDHGECRSLGEGAAIHLIVFRDRPGIAGRDHRFEILTRARDRAETCKFFIPFFPCILDFIGI